MKCYQIVLVSCVLLLCSAPSSAQARRVTATLPRVVDIERKVELVGSALPYREASIRSRVSGYVSSVAVLPGDTLSQGAVLCTVSVPELVAEREVLEALVDEAVAAVRDAEAGLARVQAERAVSVAKVAAAHAEVEVRRADVEVLKAIADRVTELHANGAATREELEEAIGARIMASARLSAAESGIAVAEAHVAAASANISAAESHVSMALARKISAEKRVAKQNGMVEFATLRNPYESGLVAMRYVDAGALVEELMTQMFVVMDVSKLRVQVQVPERDAALVSADSRVVLTFDALPGKAIETTVTRTFGVLDPMTRSMRVEIEIDNASGEYKPGMFCHASLETGSSKDALTVPGSAVYADEKGQLYLLVAVGGTAVRKPIVVGLDDGRVVEVTSGASSSDQVILGRPPGLSDGDAVDAQVVEKH